VDLGRRLRMIAGVDEQLLGRVPLERTQYTGLGGVVLGTAVVAGLSMWFFLGQVLGANSPAMIVPVLIWVLIVLNLDRWLVSKASGMWQRRIMTLVPRLLLAVALGFVVAEPMILRIFETAVVQHVVDGRTEARAALRTKLVECNPLPPATPSRADCGGGAVLFAGTTEDQVRELDAAGRDARERERALAAHARRHGRMLDLARKECAGDKGTGLSEVEGWGPRCNRLYADADAYAKTHRIAEERRDIRLLKDRITGMRAGLAGAEGDLQRRIDQAVDKREAELPRPDAPIGLLERMQALDEITEKNGFLFIASWFLRVFVIMVDCMPVLVKLMSGTTAYDRLVEMENGSRERVHAERLRTREYGDTEASRMERDRAGEVFRREREEMDITRQRDAARARTRLEEMIKDRMTDLAGRPTRKPASNGSFHPLDT
jgi:hypothetical protein